MLTAILGLLLGVCFFRFGNPVVLDDPALAGRQAGPLVTIDHSAYLRYWLLACAALATFLRARKIGVRFGFLGWVPLLWLTWQFVSASFTVDTQLTQATLKHFSGCVVMFYVGLLGLSTVRRPFPMWAGWLLGFVGVVWLGFDQHFGGLEETRRYFLTYELPKLPIVPPELWRKIHSERIFSTFIYPNSLACGLLLATPCLIEGLTHPHLIHSRLVRFAAAGLLIIPAAACLMWTGSKAGWLVAVLMCVLALSRTALPRAVWLGILAFVLVTGTAGFWLKYQTYFQKGATSVAARITYWESAWQIGLDHPLLGTGPGTFSVEYARRKPRGAEMARLAHNDYLQQLSDSGFPGFSAFSVLFVGIGLMLYRNRIALDECWGSLVGVAGWALHSSVDFNLYIPAIAWPAFLLLGRLFGMAAVAETVSDRHSTG